MRRATAIKPVEHMNQTIRGSPHNEKAAGGPVHISVTIREAMGYLSRAQGRRNLKSVLQVDRS